jgi:hypothetical protein
LCADSASVRFAVPKGRGEVALILVVAAFAGNYRRRQEPEKEMGRVAHLVAVGLAIILILSPAGQVAAQEYCVACSGPDAVYRCVVEGAQPGGGQPLQMLCITAMAKQGGHATCSVKRGTVFQCDGAVKRVPWAALNAPQAAQPPDSAPASSPAPPPKSEQAATPAPPPAGPAPGAPPETMLDLAKRANEDTAKQMKKAGDSVKEATKKTWDCVFSLFTRC